MSIETGLGAVLVPDGVDAGLAWHYGDPLAEQRALANGAGVIDRGNRGVLTVIGAERLSWLHSIITQYVSDLDDGQSTESLVLSPHGHVEQHWQLTELGGTVWIDVEPGMAGDALKYLTMMRFMKEVDLADVTADWSVITLQGPNTRDVLRAAGLPVPAVGHAAALPDGGFVRDTALVPQTTRLRRCARRGRRVDRSAHRSWRHPGRHLGLRRGARANAPPATELRDRPPHDRA